MDALARAAPPPGSANAGDLYVDLQTKTLWLGVDPSVDPAQFVLISDMPALQAEIAGAIAECKAYTDAGIATRASVTHGHSSAQIVDFTEAVTSVVVGIPGVNWVAGMILQWKGSLAEIGVGPLAGWALCDGANGTPNLRDKFIVGAGNILPGTTNPSASLTTTGGGTHIHSVAATAITVAQMPSHNHGGITGYVSHDHQHHVSGGTDGQGTHGHNNVIPGSNADNGDPGSYLATAPGNYNGDRQIGYAQNAGHHAHNFAAWSGGINQNHYHGITAEGGNQGHTHAIIGGGGVHEHNISSGQIRDTIPYYALAFIMKL